MTELATLVRVSRLYYELGETQEAIAQIVGVTRPQVSRLLKEAREQGVVEIRIVDTAEIEPAVGERLRERFGLRAVHLAPRIDGPPDVSRRRVGRLAGDVLRAALRDGMIVGVGDGGALSAVAASMATGPTPVDAVVVPLCGGYWRPGAGAEPYRRIADALGATAHPVLAPGLLEDPGVRDALLAHPGVRSAAQLWARLDVAVFGIGAPSWSEAAIGRAAFDEIAGAVGEILIAPFDATGRPVGERLRRQTIAFDARDLGRVPLSIGVAEGLAKVAPILGALRGGYLNVLVTDVPTAHSVLALADEAAA